MTRYHLKNVQTNKLGFTDAFRLTIADFTTMVNGTQIVLTALNPGDIVDPGGILQEIITYVTGPTGTPTGSVGVVGAVTQFTAASSLISAATKQVVPTAAAPYVVTAAVNMVFDIEAGGGNGAAATAGEVWIWATISRISERAAIQF